MMKAGPPRTWKQWLLTLSIVIAISMFAVYIALTGTEHTRQKLWWVLVAIWIFPLIQFVIWLRDRREEERR